MSTVTFLPREAFRPPAKGYRLLPFRFMRWADDEVLVVNEVGEFVFLPGDRFDSFVKHRLSCEHPEYQALKAKHFLLDTASDVAVDLLATKYRTKKGFLAGFTQLHLFVVSLRCDHSCPYCQVSRVSSSRERFDMSRETARRSIDLVFRSPSPALKIEFQGGEPLLNFELVRWIVDQVLERNVDEGREIQFVVATNLALLTDEMLQFFRERSVLISTSLDGPEFLHNANRPRPGNDSHAVTLRNLRWAREVLGHDRVAAVMTTTELSLQHPQEIVDEYARLGFDAIFLRSISPYGLAVKTGHAARYQTDQFLEFYRRALERVIAWNRQGVAMKEVYAQILLTKILTPFPVGYVDLQSPAGAGLGVVAYNYDGDVYVSDEARMLAEMGDRNFRLGNVHRDRYEDLFGGELLKLLVAGSVLEALPGCSDCAFQPYCGADPVFNYRTQGDVVGHRPTSTFCAKHMGIFRQLFGLLRGGDRFVVDLLTSWATGFGPEPADRRSS